MLLKSGSFVFARLDRAIQTRARVAPPAAGSPVLHNSSAIYSTHKEIFQ